MHLPTCINFAAAAIVCDVTVPLGTKPRAGGPPFVELILRVLIALLSLSLFLDPSKCLPQALTALGGRASQRQIAEHVEATFPEVVQRSNWRNSISGALSVRAHLREREISLYNGSLYLSHTYR